MARTPSYVAAALWAAVEPGILPERQKRRSFQVDSILLVGLERPERDRPRSQQLRLCERVCMFQPPNWSNVAVPEDGHAPALRRQAHSLTNLEGW